jgi:hypothetical protein
VRGAPQNRTVGNQIEERQHYAAQQSNANVRPIANHLRIEPKPESFDLVQHLVELALFVI